MVSKEGECFFIALELSGLWDIYRSDSLASVAGLLFWDTTRPWSSSLNERFFNDSVRRESDPRPLWVVRKRIRLGYKAGHKSGRRSSFLPSTVKVLGMAHIRHDTFSSTDDNTLSVDPQSPRSPIRDSYLGFPKVTSPGGDSQASNFTEPTVPPSHDNRTLVLCFDGTGDQFDDDNSNIVNFFSMLKKDDPKQQLVYYQAGIGTYTIPQIAKPMMAKFHKALDSMVGVHLNAHVMGGYEFLMQNYEAGDKILLFGFSRGAYTARALAGMIHRVGLLPKCNHQQVPFAYKMYSRNDETGWRQSAAFKRAFSIDVDIDLIGVWDTVGSVGMIPKRLPFTTFNTHVKAFRHALALDEHRVRFKPNFFNRPTHEEFELGLKWGEIPKKSDHHKPHRRKTLRELERQYTRGGSHQTDVKEVWFAGCHCDVGGGAVKNEVRNNLARISLRWMVRECFRLNTGILFHRDTFKVIGLDYTTLWPVVKDRPPSITSFCGEPPSLTRPLLSMGLNGALEDVDDFVSEEEEDLADILSAVNDMLKISKTWWILEFLPQKIRFQKDDDSWVQKLSINRGRGRVIPKQKTEGVLIHRTVDMRMNLLKDKKGRFYRPMVRLIPGAQLTLVD